MAALEASLSLTSLYSSSSSTRLQSLFAKTQLPISIKMTSTNPLRQNHSLLSLLRRPVSAAGATKLFSSLQETAVEEEEEEKEEEEKEVKVVKSEDVKSDSENHHKRKLYVVNLPWSLSVVDIKSLFGHCGNVIDVDIIKQKDGRNRGFAFVTMESGEQARDALDKLNDQEVSGRVIKVSYANSLKPPPPPGPRTGETGHKLYVGNLAWKVRATNLREFVEAQNLKPVSTRIVFHGTGGSPSGYGFISFATKEEADAALVSLDGKELMDRPLRVKLGVTRSNASKDQKEKGGVVEVEHKTEEESKSDSE